MYVRTYVCMYVCVYVCMCGVCVCAWLCFVVWRASFAVCFFCSGWRVCLFDLFVRCAVLLCSAVRMVRCLCVAVWDRRSLFVWLPYLRVFPDLRSFDGCGHAIARY